MKTKFNRLLIVATTGAAFVGGSLKAENHHRSERNDASHQHSRNAGHYDSESHSYGETRAGLSRDRTPRQGLGSEDLTRNSTRMHNSGGYARSDAFFHTEGTGTEGSWNTESTMQGDRRYDSSRADTRASRASDNERDMKGNRKGQATSDNWQRGNRYDNDSARVSRDSSRYDSQESVLNEPSGAASKRNQTFESNNQSEQRIDQSQGEAARDNALNSTQSGRNSRFEDPSGAANSATVANSYNQSSGQNDRNLSQRLRDELKNDSNLSAKTQDVQVSSVNGRITLRGTVSSEEEKRAIGAKARSMVGTSEKIDNQLKVKNDAGNR